MLLSVAQRVSPSPEPLHAAPVPGTVAAGWPLHRVLASMAQRKGSTGTPSGFQKAARQGGEEQAEGPPPGPNPGPHRVPHSQAFQTWAGPE